MKGVNKLYLLPLGSFEPHRGLPWDLDTRIALKFAQALASEVNAEVLPPIPYSLSFEWEGSISLKIETFSALLRDVRRSVKGTLVVVNAHGGNSGALQVIARQERFYVVDIYRACKINVGHAGQSECYVAKALGVLDGVCKKGVKWPQSLVDKPRIEVGVYDEVDYSFYEIQKRLIRCIHDIGKELKELAKVEETLI